MRNPALTQSNEASRPSLKLLVAIFFALIVAFHLGAALTGKFMLRDSHLGAALEYAHGPINLLRPVVPGFNATGTPTALEFPLWQAAAGLAFKITHSTWYGWANLTSLLFFATCLWPFFQLARQYVGERAAWWSLLFFLMQPLIIVNAGEAATDGFSLVVTIWFLFFADKMIRTGRLFWWIPAALFGALSAVEKLPFFMTAGFCTIFLLLINGIRTWRPWVLLATAGIFAGIVFLAWTRYTDALAAQAVYPFADLRVSHNPWIRAWYFGDMHYRLSPVPWIRGVWRFLHGTMGALPVAVLFFIPFVRPGNWMPKLWLVGAFMTTLVFTHLVLEHWHYYLVSCPAVALLCGATLARWEPFWTQQLPSPRMALALAGLALALSAADGLAAMKIPLSYDPFPREMGRLIAEHTKPTDKLIVYDVSVRWGGEELFSSGRQGMYVFSLENVQGGLSSKGLHDLLDSDADLARLKSLGYNKLVMLSESPLQFSAQAINNLKRKRFPYPASVSPKVDAWPVVYQTEDLIIKDIP
jgi:hypothetical protein